MVKLLSTWQRTFLLAVSFWVVSLVVSATAMSLALFRRTASHLSVLIWVAPNCWAAQ